MDVPEIDQGYIYEFGCKKENDGIWKPDE